jgi:hypothetical protein
MQEENLNGAVQKIIEGDVHFELGLVYARRYDREAKIQQT